MPQNENDEICYSRPYSPVWWISNPVEEVTGEVGQQPIPLSHTPTPTAFVNDRQTGVWICTICHSYFNDINSARPRICDNCQQVVCSRCGRSYSRSRTTVNQDENILCNECYNNVLTRCRHCEEEISVNDSIIYRGVSYCEDCYNDLFGECNNCGEIFNSDDLWFDEDSGNSYCQACRPDCADENNCDSHGNNGNIESYSYKPRTIFFSLQDNKEIYSSFNQKEKVYYGVELELECDESNSRKFYASLINCPFIYCKQDASLRNGIEAVSHPATFEYWMTQDPYKQIFGLAKLGCRSHDTTTCGLHVHISRTAFKDEEHLKRFMKIFYRNPSRIMRFSRREKNKLHEWASVDGVDDNTIDYKAKHGDDPNRRTAVNTQNCNTIEVRIFKGTLNKVTFYKTIEFCDAILEFTRTSNWEQTLWQGLQDYIVAHKDRYVYLNIVRNKK